MKCKGIRCNLCCSWHDSFRVPYREWNSTVYIGSCFSVNREEILFWVNSMSGPIFQPVKKFFHCTVNVENSLSYKGILRLLLLFLFLPATSDGTQSSVDDLSGGHCNDTSKNVHMRIEVYICNKTGGKFPTCFSYPKYFHSDCILVFIHFHVAVF